MSTDFISFVFFIECDARLAALVQLLAHAKLAVQRNMQLLRLTAIALHNNSQQFAMYFVLLSCRRHKLLLLSHWPIIKLDSLTQ